MLTTYAPQEISAMYEQLSDDEQNAIASLIEIFLRKKTHNPSYPKESTVETKQKNQLFYQTAQEFLQNMAPNGVQLEKYFKPDTPQSLQDVFKQFICSAQNTQRMPNVIKFGKREKIIKKVLCDFDYQKIKNISAEELFKTFQKDIVINNVNSPQNMWLRWCKSIVDSAKWVSQFKDMQAFNGFVHSFDNNPKQLVKEMAKQIHGIGFALACDAIKEMGFSTYCKPDVHIKDVLQAFNFPANNDEDIFDTILNIARDCQEIDADVTPYRVDKTIWLICSGVFYIDEQKIKGEKKAFIEKCSSLFK